MSYRLDFNELAREAEASRRADEDAECKVCNGSGWIKKDIGHAGSMASFRCDCNSNK